MFKSGRPYAGETGSPVFLCPIINAQNRNEAKIPVFIRQGRPTEIVLYRRSSAVASSSKEYVTEMFSTFERRIFRSPMVHISWEKADFYENRNWWNPLTWSEFQKKKKVCDKSVWGEDSTWGLMRVKRITYLYSNLAAEWSTIKVGESLQNNLIEMFCSTAHSLEFSALRLVARSGGGGDWFLKLLDGILLEMY